MHYPSGLIGIYSTFPPGVVSSSCASPATREARRAAECTRRYTLVKGSPRSRSPPRSRLALPSSASLPSQRPAQEPRATSSAVSLGGGGGAGSRASAGAGRGRLERDAGLPAGIPRRPLRPCCKAFEKPRRAFSVASIQEHGKCGRLLVRSFAGCGTRLGRLAEVPRSRSAARHTG